MYTIEVNLLLNKKHLCFVFALIIGLGCFLFPDTEANLSASAADEVVEVSVDDLEYEIFEDFSQMNAFLEKTWMSPECVNAKGEYVVFGQQVLGL